MCIMLERCEFLAPRTKLYCLISSFVVNYILLYCISSYFILLNFSVVRQDHSSTHVLLLTAPDFYYCSSMFWSIWTHQKSDLHRVWWN